MQEHLVTLGRALEWHGPLALYYLFEEATGCLTYISGVSQQLSNKSIKLLHIAEHWPMTEADESRV